MRQLTIFGLLLFLVSFTSSDNELSREEREKAIRYLKETRLNLENAVKDLSENQLNWKPSDSVWSVANCVEHIALSEKNIFDMAMGTLQAAADPVKKPELKLDEESIKKILTDRSFRVKTIAGFIPNGQFGNTKATLDVFNERRSGSIKYINETKDDLRNHFAELPFGWVDTYQLIIFMSAHTQRHILQIEEVKSDPGFPKE